MQIPLAARPQPHYREAFFRQLMEFRPQSVLDVGCGDGALVRRLQEERVSVVGIEVDQVLVQAATTTGLDVRDGVAGALPFADRSVDWVVSQYSLHHFADPAAALREAVRVARCGVAVLDQWYDRSVGSQQVAERFDRWCKVIDRHTGLVHGPSLGSGELLSLLGEADAELTVEVRTMLIPVPVSMQRLHEIADEALGRVHPAEPFAATLQPLLADAERQGVTDDGAIMAFGWRGGLAALSR